MPTRWRRDPPRRCANCRRWYAGDYAHVCAACYVWRMRHGTNRPFPKPGRIAMQGPCAVCGAVWLPHDARQWRLHRKIYMSRWRAKQEV